jgi:hypothetical protein
MSHGPQCKLLIRQLRVLPDLLGITETSFIEQRGIAALHFFGRNIFQMTP